MLPTLQP